ncbi:MAG: ABC transporter permease [Clostridiales bacterium]|jgi:peptide/nickel transport system permease protein|nr:ABC transporter permease [Clostridiales bacterium]
MFAYIAKRLLMMVGVVLGVVFVVFTIMYITPGDPAEIMLGETATYAEKETLREQLGLNEPFLVQFGNYSKNLFLRGDLGISYTTKQSVSSEILERFPTTLMLAVLGVAVAVGIGIPLGIISAIRQYTVFDNISLVLALTGVSMPNFWQGMMMIILFSVWLGWFPSSGFNTPLHWLMPALTIGTSSAAMIMRMTRSSMLEVVRQDYICTARAKGLKESTVIIKHALRNSLIPVITVAGLQFGALLGGSVITESIFSIPGVGKLMVDAVKQRNGPMVQGGVLFTAIIFSFVNLFVDIVYTYIDPRIRSQYSRKAKKGRKAPHE